MENLRNLMQDKYVILNVRISDGKVFISDYPKPGVFSLEDAQSMAKDRAKNNSTDYVYVVAKAEIVSAYVQDFPPVKEQHFT